MYQIHYKYKLPNTRAHLTPARILFYKNNIITNIFFVSQMVKYLDRNNTNFSLRLFEELKAIKWGNEYSFLKYYQNIARITMVEFDMDSRGLLVYYTMGMGKSLFAISLALDMINEREPIILLTKSLQENMRSSIVKYVNMRAKHEPEYFLAKLSAAELDKWIDKKFKFVSMNASNMLKQMGKAAESADTEEFDKVLEKTMSEVVKLPSLDGKLLIVDEAHNLFRAITNGSKNALGVYDLVMKSKDLRVAFLTGTPISNDVFELVPCFNMLGSRRPNTPIFPEDYSDFYKYFVDKDTGEITNKSKFQNRILGLVSYVTHTSRPGAAVGIIDKTNVDFPDELPEIIERVEMSADQYVMYQLARDKEKEESTGFRGVKVTAAMQKPKSSASSSYRVRSRQLSNFCPPEGYREAQDPWAIPAELVKSPKFERMLANINKHTGQLGLVYSQFTGIGGLGSFQRFLEANGWKRYNVGAVKISKDIVLKPKEEPSEDSELSINSLLSAYDGAGDPMTYIQHINTEGLPRIGGTTNDAELSVKELDPRECREMFAQLAIDAARMAGPPSVLIATADCNEAAPVIAVAVYSDYNNNMELIEYDLGKGVQRSKWLDAVARWIRQKSAIKTGGGNTGGVYAVISGDVPIAERAIIANTFNLDDNKHGGVIDLLLVSSTGAEGLDLKNIRHEHIMEPYWNYGRISQIKYRGIRNGSHVALSPDERNVQVYIYLSVQPEWALPKGLTEDARAALEKTTDVELFESAVKNQKSIESFNRAIHEVSIECLLNDEKYCRTCNPTNNKLYADIHSDMRRSDPCEPVKERTVAAKTITLDNIDYYYVSDNESIYEVKIYKLDKEINTYKRIRESDPEFLRVFAEIEKTK